MKVRDEIIKRFKEEIIMVSTYPEWLSNKVPVPQPGEEVRVRINYRDLNDALIKEICDKFKIKHFGSVIYRPKMNGAVEAGDGRICCRSPCLPIEPQLAPLQGQPITHLSGIQRKDLVSCPSIGMHKRLTVGFPNSRPRAVYLIQSLKDSWGSSILSATYQDTMKQWALTTIKAGGNFGINDSKELTPTTIQAGGSVEINDD